MIDPRTDRQQIAQKLSFLAFQLKLFANKICPGNAAVHAEFFCSQSGVLIAILISVLAIPQQNIQDLVQKVQVPPPPLSTCYRIQIWGCSTFYKHQYFHLRLD